MRTLILIGCIVLASATASAQQSAQPAKPFEPTVGQAGKDVVWVPSPPQMVNKMLEIAKVTPADYVIDLGSGDGRNIIAAAKLGARGHGVEFNPDMVALSRKLAAGSRAWPTRRSSSRATCTRPTSRRPSVMALFLLPVNLNKLAPKFLDLAPGSRIVGNTFGIDGWEPDFRVSLPQDTECESWCEVLLWIVPAKVARHVDPGRTGGCTLTQEYQTVQGTATVNGSAHTVATRAA